MAPHPRPELGEVTTSELLRRLPATTLRRRFAAARGTHRIMHKWGGSVPVELQLKRVCQRVQVVLVDGELVVQAVQDMVDVPLQALRAQRAQRQPESVQLVGVDEMLHGEERPDEQSPCASRARGR